MLLAATSCFKGYGLHKSFELIAASGYNGVDLVLSGSEFDTENAEYIEHLEKLTGVQVCALTAYERRMDAGVLTGIITLAERLGVTLINIYPPHRLDKDGAWFSDDLPVLKKKHPNIQFAVINVEPKTFLFFIPEYKDATLTSIKKLTGETTLSIANVNPESGVDLIKTFTVLGNSIVNVFLSDKTAAKVGLLPGKGEMPLETLLIRLREGGYKRAFTLKVDPKVLGVGNDETVLKRMADAQKFWSKHYTS
jgi:sugar phosphate isomerase/epimerase